MNKETVNELNAELYAYQQMGSSPCEDCEKIRHCGKEALFQCWKKGGCDELDKYHEGYESYKNEYLDMVLTKKNNCTNCRHSEYNDYLKQYCCWEHPDAIDHRCCMDKSEALRTNCDNYRDVNLKLCEDCEYHDCMKCTNVKNATIVDNKVNLVWKADEDICCEHFKEKH